MPGQDSGRGSWPSGAWWRPSQSVCSSGLETGRDFAGWSPLHPLCPTAHWSPVGVVESGMKQQMKGNSTFHTNHFDYKAKKPAIATASPQLPGRCTYGIKLKILGDFQKGWLWGRGHRDSNPLKIFSRWTYGINFKILHRLIWGSAFTNLGVHAARSVCFIPCSSWGLCLWVWQHAVLCSVG